MMQAIEASYCGPTNCNGSRVKVQCAAKTKFYQWNDALNNEQNYKVAAESLMLSLGWKANLIGGVLKNGSYVFVLQELRK